MRRSGRRRRSRNPDLIINNCGARDARGGGERWKHGLVTDAHVYKKGI